MIRGVNTFRPTDGVDDQIEAWGSFTGLPEVTHTHTHQDLDWARIETWGDGEGVTAAFYRANACSDEKLQPNFNWPVLRAIRGYKRAITGSNWEITNPKSIDHGGVPRGGVKN
jgi:hypothetical protein